MVTPYAYAYEFKLAQLAYNNIRERNHSDVSVSSGTKQCMLITDNYRYALFLRIRAHSVTCDVSTPTTTTPRSINIFHCFSVWFPRPPNYRCDMRLKRAVTWSNENNNVSVHVAN